MIIRSFFRQKRTKIYIFIITILLIFSSLLFAAIRYLDKVNNEKYYAISLFYIESSKIDYNQLSNSDDFINIHKALKFRYDDDIFKQEDLGEFELDNMVLVYADENNKYNLKDNEVIIIFNRNSYDNNESRFKESLNQNIKFYFKDEDIILKIKKFEKDNRSKLIISKTLFDNLNLEYENNIYTTNFKSEDLADKYNYSQFFNYEDIYLNLDTETASNFIYRENLKNNLKIVQYATLICIGVFILLLIVVNKNIISDLKNNLILEKRLGYNNYQISINILKRLSTLHLICYFITLIVTLTAIISFNIFFNNKIDFSCIIKITILMILILISDLLLSLIVNNKSNTGERRKNKMKKVVKVLAILMVCSITVMSPSAKSLKSQALYGLDNNKQILKYGTEGKFHTSIYPLSKNADSITVQNIIQRKDKNGTFIKVVRNNMNITQVKRSYILNVSFATTTDTRSIWYNITRGTTVTADLYINNGFDYDINFEPNIIGYA